MSRDSPTPGSRLQCIWYLELQKDPKFAPLIIEFVKMQRVDELGDYAVTRSEQR
jgi:hypothetical protein